MCQRLPCSDDPLGVRTPNTVEGAGALRVLSPSEVAHIEPVLPWPVCWRWAAANLLGATRKIAPGEFLSIATGTPISQLPGFAAAWRAYDAAALAAEAEGAEVPKHVVVVERRPTLRSCFGRPVIHVLFERDASQHDVYRGFLHAALTAELVAAALACRNSACALGREIPERRRSGTVDPSACTCRSDAESVQVAGVVASQNVSTVTAALANRGWWVNAPLLATEVGGRLISRMPKRQ